MNSAAEWPASKFEIRTISGLVPFARNSRTHSPEQVDQIAASMREWEWTSPVLVDEKDTVKLNSKVLNGIELTKP